MNPISSHNLSKVITKMTKADALAPVIALEATVVTGRTYQAYKRGKWDEARERFIEESMGSVVWLGGVASLNKLGDKAIGKILKKPGANFDVGTDKILRTPFDNFMKNVAPKGFSPKQVALIKGAKVMTSIVLANLFIGFVMPKINQGLTKKLRHERRVENEQNTPKKTNSQPSFKGGPIGAINAFTNCIENTNTGKLLSSDAGIAGGRMYNARRKEERREIAIRDIGSIYFYMWAQGHVGNLMNLVESGHATRLNPSTTKIFNEYLSKYVGDKDIDVNEFKKAVLGEEKELKSKFTFETEKLSSLDKIFNKKPLEVIKLSDAEKLIDDESVLKRAREMSTLQPKRMGEAVLTKQQLIDAYNKAEINNASLLHDVFDDFTGGNKKKNIKGDYINEYKYVSNKKLYKLKSEMAQYIDTICKEAKGGKINKALLNKVEKKNLIFNGVNFVAGFAVAAAFLSTFIPKLQYYVTRKTTGVDAFPGVYDFEHHHEEID